MTIGKRGRRSGLLAALIGSAVLAGGGTLSTAVATGGATNGGIIPDLVGVPNLPSLRVATRDANTDCTLPDGTLIDLYHCYTPQQIRSAYAVDAVPPITVNGQTVANYGQGQTIVLVDSYGSPTATADLQKFHDTFFANLPNPDFNEVYPLGNPNFPSSSNSKGKSGPTSAAGWSGEATLDIEWSYAIAPLAHIVLLAVPPAETEGVQGFPNLFKAISREVGSTPPGTVFSMSFGVTEQTFGGAAAAQTAKFDQVFQQGLAKGDNFFAATGDYGTYNAAKQAKNTANYNYPTVGWPATSPYVVAVGGTQLQYGWTWDPTSNDPSTSGYWNSTPGGDTQAVWNESWAPIATGGGASVIYPRPAWQTVTGFGNSRLVPDVSWNAAVNGGVDVYITAYPQYNCGNNTGCWSFSGGTSAATPQTAASVALVNAARAAAGKAPIGFLDAILYSGAGASDYTDVVPVHQGTAPASFGGANVTASGAVSTVDKSAGDLVDNQLWEVPVAGYPTTSGYDPTTGWGVPNVASLVTDLSK
jgi:subtilase family serine protease